MPEHPTSLALTDPLNHTALGAFVHFTEASSSALDAPTLLRTAHDVLHSLLPDVHVMSFELMDGRWIGALLTGDLDGTFRQTAEAGFPGDLPALMMPFTQGRPVFFDTWDAEREGAPSSEMYRAGALYPYHQEGQPRRLLSISLIREAGWTELERRVFLSVGRSLHLAFERLAQTEQLVAQNAELDARSRALEAFMAFSEAAGTQTDVLALSRLAFEALRTRFSDTSTAVYSEVRGEHVYARSWSADIDDQPDLLAALQGGTPLSAPLLAEAAQTGEAAFTAHWDPEREQIAHTEAYGAAAVYPLRVGGTLCGLLGLGLRRQRAWSGRDAAVLRAVGRGLTLALERADLAAHLQQQNVALERGNRELLSANEELEAFAYSASHDLRTPVRHVQSFAQLARRALDKARPDTALGHLTVIEGAAERMSAMIDALLTLSRSARTPLSFGPVDLNRLLAVALRDVTPDLAGREVQWAYPTLPTVHGDAATLQQVMTNLLANAVKFTGPRARAHIRVWAEPGDHTVSLFVGDNGVGFDPQYAGRLFGAFQRLHTEREFGGSGVGLATVRRIVLRHGGRVFAEGKPGEGATFGFTLPHRPIPAGADQATRDS